MDENLALNLKPYVAPVSPGTCEISAKKSIFIAFASPINSPEEADLFLSKIIRKYPDARHHVYAWSVSGKVFREKYSDDHEPAGTAGIPISSMLSSNNISNVIVVVVRYFGGTLLGTGGLVRAYTKAACDALNNSDLRTMELNAVFSISCDYGDYERIKRYCYEKSFYISDEIFAENVSCKISVPFNDKDDFVDKINDNTNGRATLNEIGSKYLPGEKRIYI